MNHVCEKDRVQWMVPMYLGRWISFYMDINDQLFAGAKGRCKSSSINQCYASTKKKQKCLRMKLK